MTTKEKIVYKVWDKTNEKFISPNGKKSQWNSLTWATAALRNVVKPYYARTRTLEEFEVQAFRLVMVESWPGREVYDAKEKKAKELQQAKEKRNQILRDIAQFVPGVDVYKAQEMWRKGMFSITLSDKLERLFFGLKEV